MSIDPIVLYQELIRQYKAGNLAGATELALRLVEVKYDSHGEHHPEYAAALCHYSLLLQASGDLEGANDGLQEVLKVRRESLGGNHPTVAMTLSQIGMLLVESRKWKEAEAPLLESVAIRREVLGEDHPSLETDLKVLAMLAERSKSHRHAREIHSIPIHPPTAIAVDSPPANVAPPVSIDTATAIDQPVAIASHLSAPPTAMKASNGSVNPPAVIISAPPPASEADAAAETAIVPKSDAAEPAPKVIGDHQRIKNEMQALAGSFTRIGTGMTFIGQRMKTQGFPPNPQLLYEATSCHRKFAGLCDEAIRRAEELELDLAPFISPGEDRFSLPDLTLLFEEIFKCTDNAAKNDVARKTTLAVIARVLELTHVDPRKQAILKPVHELAEKLHVKVKESPRLKPPAEAIAIVDGVHPLYALDRLVMTYDTLDDDSWTRLFEIVAQSHGKRLATAAARNHLRPLRPRATSPISEDASEGAENTPSSQQRVTDLMDSLIDDEDFMPARANREALARRIAIPDAPAPLKRPTLGSAPRASVEEAIQAPPQAKPVRTAQPAAPAVPKPAAQRPSDRPRDPYDFLRTQTSIISQY